MARVARWWGRLWHAQLGFTTYTNPGNTTLNGLLTLCDMLYRPNRVASAFDEGSGGIGQVIIDMQIQRFPWFRGTASWDSCGQLFGSSARTPSAGPHHCGSLCVVLHLVHSDW